MKVNKKYKDSVFVKLFSNKKEIINLYNASKAGSQASANLTSPLLNFSSNPALASVE